MNKTLPQCLIAWLAIAFVSGCAFTGVTDKADSETSLKCMVDDVLNAPSVNFEKLGASLLVL